MYVFLTILAILVCVLLMLIVLIQNPKGGGLSSSFGPSNQIMGVQKTGDFLEKATWGLAICLLFICLGMKVFTPHDTTSSVSAIQKQIDRTQLPSQQPAPASVPPVPNQRATRAATAPAKQPSTSPSAVPMAAPTKAPAPLAFPGSQPAKGKPAPSNSVPAR